MDLRNEPSADSYVYGTAIEELAHVVRVCLEQGVSAYQAIDAVIQCAEMGSTKYPVSWIALDPRVHYFPSFEMALANAMLSVPPAFSITLAILFLSQPSGMGRVSPISLSTKCFCFVSTLCWRSSARIFRRTPSLSWMP